MNAKRGCNYSRTTQHLPINGSRRLRRRALVLSAVASPILAWSSTAFAQTKPPILIAWLNTESRELGGQYLSAFKEGLAALGWKEGAQYVVDERWADGRIDRLPALAEELAARKPAIILAASVAAVPHVAKAAPKTVIVAMTGHLVALGLAQSLARPGGMITGISSLGTSLTEKYLEFLLAAAPKVQRVGIMIDSTALGRASLRDAARRSVAQYKVDARFAEVASPEQIEPALARLAKEGAQGLIVTAGPLVRNERRRIVELALAHRWPVVAGAGGWAEVGALVSYTADSLWNYRRAAYYVDRILKGTKPADLPIEQPTRFEFIVNLKTAKLLGLTMPPEIMVRADRVIE